MKKINRIKGTLDNVANRCMSGMSTSTDSIIIIIIMVIFKCYFSGELIALS